MERIKRCPKHDFYMVQSGYVSQSYRIPADNLEDAKKYAIECDSFHVGDYIAETDAETEWVTDFEEYHYPRAKTCVSYLELYRADFRDFEGCGVQGLCWQYLYKDYKLCGYKMLEKI